MAKRRRKTSRRKEVAVCNAEGETVFLMLCDGDDVIAAWIHPWCTKVDEMSVANGWYETAKVPTNHTARQTAAIARENGLKRFAKAHYGTFRLWTYKT